MSSLSSQISILIEWQWPSGQESTRLQFIVFFLIFYLWCQWWLYDAKNNLLDIALKVNILFIHSCNHSYIISHMYYLSFWQELFMGNISLITEPWNHDWWWEGGCPPGSYPEKSCGTIHSFHRCPPSLKLAAYNWWTTSLGLQRCCSETSLVQTCHWEYSPSSS